MVGSWSCWEGGVLESDRALDAVAGHLSRDVGVNLHFTGQSDHYANDTSCEHEPKARSAEDTRVYLDRGNFSRVFNKYMNKKGMDVGREAMTGPENAIILTAKAMSVGARITDGQKSFIRREYKRCGLNREAIEQIGKALDEYVSGTPYKLPEPDRSTHNIHDSHESARSEAGFGMALMDYPADRYFEEDVPTTDPSKITRDQQRRRKNEPTWFPGSPVLRECGECGMKAYHCSESLKMCGQCEKIMYCSRTCQKKHWALHKKHCAKFKAGPEPTAIETLEKSPMLVDGFDPLGGGPQQLGGGYTTQGAMTCPLI